jgi:terminase large subunit-like protein
VPSVRALRRKLELFARLLGVYLTPWQVRSLRMETYFTLIAAGRRVGKSLCLALLALHAAFRKPEQRILLLSASEAAGRELLRVVLRLIAAAPILRDSVVVEEADRIVFSNGSEILIRPASERAIRGLGVDLLLIDEAAFLPDSLLVAAALPTTAAQEGARVVMASTPSQASGAFFDLFRRGEVGDEHVRSFRWVPHLTGGDCRADWLQPSFIEAQRQTMSALMFDAEFRAQFGTGGDFFISRPRLDRALADYAALDLAEVHGPARGWLGVDWGRRSDRTAGVDVARVPIPGERVFAVVGLHRFPAGVPIPGVVAELCASPAHYGAVIAEKTGMGDPSCDFLFPALAQRPPERGGGRSPRRLVVYQEKPWLLDPVRVRTHRERLPGFHTTAVRRDFTAQSKPPWYAGLRLLLERDALAISSGFEQLIRELLLLKVDFTPSGGERVEASAGTDDLCDALVLATGPYRSEAGDYRTRLAELAHHRYPLPDSEPALPSGLPTVPTGSGLELPVGPGRVPIFQSVTGEHLTFPPGVEPPEIRPAGKRDTATRLADGVTMRRAP